MNKDVTDKQVALMMELLTRLKEAKNLSWFKRMYLNLGICHLVSRDTDSYDTAYRISALLRSVCFSTWKDYSGNCQFPVYVPKYKESPAGQFYDKLLWNPFSKYGRKRMELLDHSIEVLSNLIEEYRVEKSGELPVEE